MKILMIGNSGMMDEWNAVCSTHECVCCENVDAQVFASNEFDLIIDLYLEHDSQKKDIIQKIHRFANADTPIISNTICVTATEVASWIHGKERVIGVAALPSSFQADRIEICFPMKSEKSRLARVTEFFSSIGKTVEEVQDNIGMVFPRILCMIINEAFFAMEQGVAEAEAIDTAMKLATNYPIGPVEWGKKIGLKNVFTILNALHTEFGDDRYRPAPLLKKTSL